MLRYLEDYAIPINRLWLTISLLDRVVVYKIEKWEGIVSWSRLLIGVWML